MYTHFRTGAISFKVILSFFFIFSFHCIHAQTVKTINKYTAKHSLGEHLPDQIVQVKVDDRRVHRHSVEVVVPLVNCGKNKRFFGAAVRQILALNYHLCINYFQYDSLYCGFLELVERKIWPLVRKKLHLLNILKYKKCILTRFTGPLESTSDVRSLCLNRGLVMAAAVVTW